jgi:glutamine amidotransferase
MAQLKQYHLDQAIHRFLETGRPFLGICLGMQLFFERSEEGDVRGLGLLPGVVRRFPAQPGLKVPHMGWNRLEQTRLALLPEQACFYFVHSYYADPDRPEHVAAWSRHGIPFAAAVARDQILLTQFHPEKSGDAGLKLLTDWVTGR